MAVKLRLRRTGAKHQPRYRIVAADARSPRDGRFIEALGHYNPTRQPHEVVVNAELARKWLSRGAQPTDTVRQLLIEQGILTATYAPPKSPAVEPAAAAQAPAPAAPQPEEPLAAPEPASESMSAQATVSGEAPAEGEAAA